jgi:hypothetical protein
MRVGSWPWDSFLSQGQSLGSRLGEEPRDDCASRRRRVSHPGDDPKIRGPGTALCPFHISLWFRAGAFQKAACALGLVAWRDGRFEKALRGPGFQIFSCLRSLPRDGIALRSPLTALWNCVSALCSREPPLQRAATHEPRDGTREQRAHPEEERVVGRTVLLSNAAIQS